MKHTKEYEETEKGFRQFLDDEQFKPRAEQVFNFKNKFKLGRSTYYAWLKNIKENKPLSFIPKRYSAIINKKSMCYFCRQEYKLLVHHVDANRTNNKKTNLIILCRSCHIKLHNLLNTNKHFSVYIMHINIEKGTI